MVEFIMPIYKIIFAFIIFCFFQTNQSISLELKIPKIGDLKKITEDIKKEIEEKEPEVKKEEVKKEEVKKEEVKKEEVKKEEDSGVVIIHNTSDFTFEFKKAKRKIDSNLPNCKDLSNAKEAKVARNRWDKCYGIRLKPNGSSYEGEWKNMLRVGKFFVVNKTEGLVLPVGTYKCTYTYDDQNGVCGEPIIDKKEEAKKLAKIKEKQKICEDKDFTKSNKIGGYKHFYFGMPIEDALQFKNCVGEFMVADETEMAGPLRLNKLYNDKHEVQIYFFDDKVDMVTLRLFSDLDYEQSFSYGVTSIEKFEQIKKVVLDKYKLLTKPNKNSIDEFNNEKYANLTWTLKDRDFDILLELTKSPPIGTAQTFFYKGWVSYLSPDQVKRMLEAKDGEKVKSSDF